MLTTHKITSATGGNRRALLPTLACKMRMEDKMLYRIKEIYATGDSQRDVEESIAKA
jgi:hypothetical protein